MAHEETVPNASPSDGKRKRRGKNGKALIWGLAGLCLAGLALESRPVANEPVGLGHPGLEPVQLARLEVGTTISLRDPIGPIEGPAESPFTGDYISAPLEQGSGLPGWLPGFDRGFLSAPMLSSEAELGRWLFAAALSGPGGSAAGFRASPLDRVLGQPSELECLALNIYFESRGETLAGRQAVGHVTMNRMLDPAFPNSVCGVVRQGALDGRKKGCQFSWWCDGRSDRPVDPRAWSDSQALARSVYWDRSRDPTDGALWFHADYVSPDWASAFDRGPQIGRHLFYRRPDPARDARDFATLLPWSF